MAKEQESQTELRELPTKLGPQRRAMNVEGYDPEARTVTMAISSEQPVERYFGTEILSHKPGAIRMGRLKGGMPLLFNHDSNLHLGVTTGHELGKDGVLRTVNQLGSNPLAREKEGDVKDGILKDVSLAYIIHKAQVEEDDNGHRTVTAIDWEPLENSLVTIPADPSVGVGRSAREAPDAIPVEYVFATRSASAETTAARMEGDEDEDDEDEEDEDASDSDNSRSTQPTETRTTMAAEVTIDHAAERKQRNDGLVKLRTAYPKEFSESDLARAISEDTPYAAVAERIADLQIANSQRSNVATIGDGVVADMSKREAKSYSMVRALRSAINSRFNKNVFKEDAEAGFEREVSDELRKRAQAEGLQVGGGFLRPSNLPINTERAMQAARAGFGSAEMQARTLAAGGNAGTTTNFTTTETTAIELLRVRTRSLALGAQQLSGLSGILRMPRQNAAAQSSWLAEGAASTDSNIGFDDIMLTPKRLGITGSYYMELLAQSALAIEDMLRMDQVAVEAITLDYAAIAGSGANNIPLGLLLQSGLAAILPGKTTSAAGAGGVALTYLDIISFLTQVSKANADDGTLGWMFTPEVRGYLMGTPQFPSGLALPIWPGNPSGDGTGLTTGPLGFRAGVTNQLPKNGTLGSATNLHTALFGDFSSMLFADWGIRELIVDNITQAKSGMYIVTENSLHDTNVRHIEKFVASTTILAQ